MNQNKMDKLFLSLINIVSNMSYAKRKKVGAILIKEGNIIGFGWNGMPTGFSNNCEVDNKTKPEVIHAEMNVYTKAMRQGINTTNSELYISISPCYECAKLIVQAGTIRVVYNELYKDRKVIKFLEKAGIKVQQRG